MTPVRRSLLAFLAAGALFTGAAGCSASGDVDTEGDGIQVEGDVDETSEEGEGGG